jgi:hypothetical protein
VLKLKYQLSQVIGNLISSFILKDDPTKNANTLMVVYICIAGASCLCFFFLRPEVSDEEVCVVREEPLIQIFGLSEQE